MPVVTLREESERQNGFYTPQFQVKIDHSGLPQDVVRDVLQITYTDNIKEIDRFEIIVNNWDPSRRRFKYLEPDRDPNHPSPPSAADTQRYELFEPCNKVVKVHTGYLKDPQLMMTGNFTTLEPTFPASGGPTLTVRGLN